MALADKLDTLVGFWAIDEKPTGSKDPYALRRAALGVIRIVLENELRLPLATVASQQLASLRQQIAERSALSIARDLAAQADAGGGRSLDAAHADAVRRAQSRSATPSTSWPSSPTA